MKMRIIWWICLFTSLAQASAAISTPVRSEHTEATLISEYLSLKNDQQWFSVFLRMKMDPEWHTYWVNPGDSGFPTTIIWTLPVGFTADPIKWPPPQLISVPPLMSYGYENEVWLATDIHTPGNFKVGDKISISAEVKWLECKDICIPAKAHLSLDFPVEKHSRLVTDPALSAQIAAAAKSAFHFEIPNQRNEATYDTTALHFLIKDFWGAEDNVANAPASPHPMNGLQSARFIPVEGGLIEDAEAQSFTKVGRDLVVSVLRDPNTSKLPATYDGIFRFAFTDGKKRWTQDVYSSGPLAPAVVLAPKPVVEEKKATFLPLLLALLAAFGGGLILNLMPCVLPVLSLKVLGMVEQAKQDHRSSLMHGLAFTAGVLVTFWTLAGVIIVFAQTGHHLGWGFQLQNPKVVVVLASLFFLIALNLFGVFEIGTSLASVQVESSGLGQSFFSGLLATIVATPCTAPFMGSALAFAFTQPGFISLLVFTFLGLGMAAPYLLLSASPSFLRYVPKPGPWMETFKQLMGFPMMASVLWLLWVFSHQGGLNATISVLMGLLIMSLAAWLFGRYGSIEHPSGTRFVASAVAACLLIVGLGISLPPTPDADAESSAAKWEKFDPDRLQQLRDQGVPVFVDFTATWCLTCQVNKRVALNVDEVQAKFHEKGVVLMEADWTNQDATISKALQSFGQNSVPVYVLYGKDKLAAPVLLPEILTPDLVIKALDKI